MAQRRLIPVRSIIRTKFQRMITNRRESIVICSCTVRCGLHLHLEPFSELWGANIEAYSTHKRDIIPDILFAFRRVREECIAFVMSVTDGRLDGMFWGPIIAIA